MDHSPKSSKQAMEETEVRLGWRMAGIGMQVTSEVAAGALLGFLFDLWRGSGHTGVLVGSIIGIGVGLWSLIRQSLKLNRQLDLLAPTKGRGKALPPDPPSEDKNEDLDRWKNSRK